MGCTNRCRGKSKKKNKTGPCRKSVRLLNMNQQSQNEMKQANSLCATETEKTLSRVSDEGEVDDATLSSPVEQSYNCDGSRNDKQS